MRADSHYVEQLDAPPENQVIRSLPVDRIDVAPERRADKDQKDEAALVASIQRHGVLQPLLVQHRKGRYRLIAGRRRLTAAAAAGLHAVPCLVYHVDDDEAQGLATATNIVDVAAPAEPAAIEAVDRLPGAATELSKSLARTISYLGLLEPSALPQDVLTNLARAESARAWCLGAAIGAVRAADPMRTTVAVTQLVRRITDLCEPERRLRAVGLELRVSVRDATYVDADADAIVAAVAGTIIAALEDVHGSAGATVTFTASVEARNRLALSVVRTGTRSSAAPSSFAVILRGALASIADAHSGRIVVSQQRQDVTQMLELPLAASTAM